MLNRKLLIYNTIVFILFFFIYYKLYTDADHHITHKTPNSISKCKNKIPQMLTLRSDINTPEYTTLPDQFKARLFNALRGSYKKKSGGATSWIIRERKNDLVKLYLLGMVVL